MVTETSDISKDSGCNRARSPDLALSGSSVADIAMALGSSTGYSELNASWSWDTNLDSGGWPVSGHSHNPQWQQWPQTSIQSLAVIGSWTQTWPSVVDRHRISPWPPVEAWLMYPNMAPAAATIAEISMTLYGNRSHRHACCKTRDPDMALVSSQSRHDHDLGWQTSPISLLLIATMFLGWNQGSNIILLLTIFIDSFLPFSTAHVPFCFSFSPISPPPHCLL